MIGTRRKTSDAVVGIAGAAALAWWGVPAGASAAGTAANLAAQGALEAEPVVESAATVLSNLANPWPAYFAQTGFDTQAALVAGYSAMAALYALPLLRRALGPKADGDDFRSRQPKALESGECGSSRFNESPRDLLRTTDHVRAGRTARLDRTGIYLGCGQGRYYYVGGIVHMLVAGQTGAGKTRRWLLPTMELLSRGAREAFVVADPKGEIYAAMKALLEARGYAVWRIDLKQAAYSDGYDPLAIVREAWDARDFARAEAYARDLAVTFVPDDVLTGDNMYFWQGARSVIAAVILYLVSRPIPAAYRTMANVYRIISEYGEPVPVNPKNPEGKHFVPLNEMLAELPFGHPARSALAEARHAAEDNRQALFSTALSAIKIFGDANIARTTSSSDVDLRALAKGKNAVFLILDPDKPAYHRIATLFVSQSHQVVHEEADALGGRCPFDLTYMLEEAAQLPAIPNLSGHLAIDRSYRIRWCIVVQDYGQLREKYRDTWTSIRSNCTYKMLLQSDDVEYTLPYFRDCLGKMTVRMSGSSASTKLFSIVPSSTSDSQRSGAADLMPVSDLTHWSVEQGALVVRPRRYATVYPLPDLADTPSGRMLGDGTEEQNARRAELTLNPDFGPVRPDPLAYVPGLPDYSEGVRYGPDELERAQQSFIKGLGARRAKRLARQTKPAAQGKEPGPTPGDSAGEKSRRAARPLR